ncbi:MAG: hypothetical protein ACD_75C01479G0001, partial [uncultured bacterium]
MNKINREPVRQTMQEHIFRTTTRVLYGDTDAGGVVYN